jgi:hypothetical protein
MKRLFVSLSFLLAAHGVALAQSSDIVISSFDPENAVAPDSGFEGPGVKVGEGTVLRPVFGVETGFISNVFYQDVNERAVGVLRLLAQVGTSSLSKERLQSPGGGDSEQQNDGNFSYKANLRASYDLMLTSNDTAQETGGLGLGAQFKGVANQNGRVAFGFDENFVRLIRAANFETDANTNRDINTLSLKLLYQPPDRSVTGFLYYSNTIDIFERSEQSFADRMLNTIGIQPMWRWLPQTTLFANLSIGYNTGIGSDAMKATSFPLTTTAGVSTLLTLKTTLSAQAGYTNGFYTEGPSFSAPTAGVQLGYRYSPLGRVMASYNWMYQDSVNANFYRDHVARLWVQQFVAPFVLMAQPEVHFRKYEGISAVAGPPTRDDVIISVIGGIHYNFRNWIGATLEYHFTSVQTDYTYMVDGIVDDPSYLRHQLLLGMRVAM